MIQKLIYKQTIKILILALLVVLIITGCNKESVVQGYLKIQATKSIDTRVSYRNSTSTPIKLNINGEDVIINCGSNYSTGTQGSAWAFADSLRFTYLTGTFSNATSGFYINKANNAIVKYNAGATCPSSYPGFTGAVVMVAKKSPPFATTSFISIPANTFLYGGTPFNTYNPTPQFVMGTDAYIAFAYQKYTGTTVTEEINGWIHVVLNNTDIYFDNYAYSNQTEFKIGDKL